VYYTVEFVDGSGKVLKTESVKSGKNATPPSDPTKAGWEFTGWSGNTTNIQAPTDIYAMWREIIQEHTVRFLNGQGGTVLKTEQVQNGGNAKPPSDPTKVGWEFTGWSGNATNIQAPTDIYATWREIIQEHTVRFLKEQGGTVLKTEKVQNGGNATPPTDPTKAGWEFTGWSGNATNIQAPTDIYAMWCEIINETDINEWGFHPDVVDVKPEDAVGFYSFNYFATHSGDIERSGQNNMSITLENDMADLGLQNDSLISGYNTAAAVYTGNSKYAAVADAQRTYHGALRSVTAANGLNTQMAGAVDSVLDSVFGDSGAERGAFDTEFTAYQLGNYYYKKRSQNYDYTADGEAFINALNGVSLSTPKSIDNVAAIIDELRNNGHSGRRCRCPHKWSVEPCIWFHRLAEWVLIQCMIRERFPPLPGIRRLAPHGTVAARCFLKKKSPVLKQNPNSGPYIVRGCGQRCHFFRDNVYFNRSRLEPAGF
jgi:hypothetical protein